jgi:hypothetical protein
MREELGVVEVQKTGRVISHAVGVARNVGEFAAVTVVALVEAVELAEVGAGPVCGGGAFEHAGNGRCVVRARADGEFCDTVLLGDDVQVGDGGSMLEVAVGDDVAID